MVLVANCAGPLFGPPGGSALFDAVLSEVLSELGVPAPAAPDRSAGRPVGELTGGYGPAQLTADGPDDLLLHAVAFGEADPVALVRDGGDTFTVRGRPPGATDVAVDGDLLYIGPFALPRTSRI